MITGYTRQNPSKVYVAFWKVTSYCTPQFKVLRVVFKAYDEAYDEAFDEAYDEAYDETYEKASTDD